MKPLTQEIKQVIAKSDLVSIVTNGKDGAHVVATWGSFIADLMVDDGETLLVPAGGYHQTEENLQTNDRIVLLAGSKQVPGKSGKGCGYRLNGHARIETEGDYFDKTKEKFSWVRAVLVITIAKAEQLI